MTGDGLAGYKWQVTTVPAEAANPGTTRSGDGLVEYNWLHRFLCSTGSCRNDSVLDCRHWNVGAAIDLPVWRADIHYECAPSGPELSRCIFISWTPYSNLKLSRRVNFVARRVTCVVHWVISVALWMLFIGFTVGATRQTAKIPAVLRISCLVPTLSEFCSTLGASRRATQIGQCINNHTLYYTFLGDFCSMSSDCCSTAGDLTFWEIFVTPYFALYGSPLTTDCATKITRCVKKSQSSSD